jgi:hypothetical protein
MNQHHFQSVLRRLLQIAGRLMPAAMETIGQIGYYSRAMKAPRIREAATRLADQAREGGWTHEDYSPQSCPGKSQPGKPPALKSGPGPPVSRPGNH